MVSSDLGPTLVTERLILRPPVAEDFDPYAQLMAEEATARFIGGVQSRADAWRGFLTMAGAWVMQGFSFLRWWIGRPGNGSVGWVQ